MSFQTCKTFLHLQNTNADIFDEIQELSDIKQQCINSNVTDTFKALKFSMDIVKIVHVSPVVQPYFMKPREYFLCSKKTKITILCCLCRVRKLLDFIKKKYIFFCVPKMNEGLMSLERCEGE